MEKKYYIPSSFKLGTGIVKSQHMDIYNEIHDRMEISYPSCRFMNEEWTDIKTFEFVSGYRPTNMVDKTKEIMKFISESVVDVKNDPVENFEIVGINKSSIYENGWSMYGQYVILKDQRDFKFEIHGEDFMRLIMNKKTRISEERKLSCEKMVFAWEISNSNKSVSIGWNLIPVDSEEYRNAIFEDGIKENLLKNPGLNIKDMTPGCIYDYEDRGTTKRLLFLGKRKLYGKKYLCELFNMHDVLNSGYNKYDSYIEYKRPFWKNAIENEKLEEKNYFLNLDMIYPYNFNFLDFDLILKKAGKPSWKNLTYGSIISPSGGRKFRKKSEDQKICSGNGNNYTYDEINIAIDKFTERIENILDEDLKNFKTIYENRP